MDLLLVLTYATFCYAVFKIFRIPVNQWTLATAALGGVIGIAMLLLLMNYNHPYTQEARFYFSTTPIIPVVRGPVTEVPVQPNVPVKKGDVLFRIDARPYEFVVQQKQAALAEAEQNVLQLKASLDASLADVREATATRDRTKQSYDRFAEGNEGARRAGRAGPYSELEIENRRQAYLGSEGGLASTRAAAERARLASESQINGVNTTVARLQAELRDAQYELDQTTVRAPTDGYVTQLLLRPGMMAVPLPLRPVMVFIHEEDKVFGAAFQQNSLQRVRQGDEAEIAFDGVPGRIFRGKVKFIVDAMVQGQLQATGSLIDPQERKAPGRVVAVIDILDDLAGLQLPGGAAGQVAVYTEHWHHVAVMRRILLRMKSWMNYVFLEGH
jgi:multidrug resistance efflux pump